MSVYYMIRAHHLALPVFFLIVSAVSMLNAFPAPARSDTVRTNMEMLSAAADSMARRMIYDFSLSSGRAVCLKFTHPLSPLQIYIQRKVEAGMNRRGIDLSAAENDEAAVKLEIIIVNAAVRYDGTEGGGLFRDEKIIRTAELKFVTRGRTEESGEPYMTRMMDVRLQDRFPSSHIHRVEDGRMLTGRVERPPQRLKGWIEYALAAVTLGAISYFFYAARSK